MRADDIVAERPVIVQSLGLAGALALAFATIIIAQNAMRVGLLTKFLGILGIVVGALYVLGVVFPLGTDAIRLFWIVAVGLVVLGWWPGGRGPAWESGQPEEWLSPAQRRALEQADAEEDAPPLPRRPTAGTATATATVPTTTPTAPAPRASARRSAGSQTLDAAARVSAALRRDSRGSIGRAARPWRRGGGDLGGAQATAPAASATAR